MAVALFRVFGWDSTNSPDGNPKKHTCDALIKRIAAIDITPRLIKGLLLKRNGIGCSKNEWKIQFCPKP